MKKIISIIIAGLLLITSVPFAASAEDIAFLDPYDVLEFESLGGWYQITGIKEGASGKLVIPETYSAGPVKIIYDGAFKNATGLTEVIFSQNLEIIGEEAFAGCTSLTRVEFFNSVTEIAENAFNDCPVVFYAPAETYPLTYAAENGIEAHEIVHERYTITYSTVIEGLDFVIDFEYYENTNIQIKMNADPKEGSEFFGWADQDGKEYKNGSYTVMPSKNLILTPVYRKIYRVYFLTGDVDNIVGKTEYMLEKSYTTKFELQASSVFSRSGYNLSYWLCEESGEQFTPSSTFTMPESEVHMYAVWSPKKYTFTFKANNGTSDTFTASGIYREGMEMPECPFTRPEYHFVGWKYGNETAIYMPGDIFELPTLKTGVNPAQFSAQWELGEEDIIPEFTYGDFTGDEKTTISDLIILAKAISNKYTLSVSQKYAADTNGDGKVNGDDLLVLIKFISGEIKTLPFKN